MPHTSSGSGALRSNLGAITLALVLVLALSSFLQWRASAEPNVKQIEPMPVASTVYRLEQSFDSKRQFLGLVQAGQRTDLGFESAGLLAEVAVNEGAKVSAGQVLARLDEQRLQAQRSAAAAELDTLKAELELARLKAKRQQDLQATGAVSREAYDESRLRAEALAAQHKAIQAQLKRLDIDLDKLMLRAPFDGVVAARYLDPGTVVAPGTAILRLIQSGVREAHIGVAAPLIENLEIGHSYQLNWRDQQVPATLRAVRPDIDPRTRTAIAVFSLPENSTAMDGEAITLELAHSVQQAGGWLPLAALLEGQRGIWNVLSLTEQDGQTLSAREVVEVLELRADQAYVRGTLVDGQRVIADGIHRVAPGSPVTVLER